MISSENIALGLEKKTDLDELKRKNEHLGDMIWALDRDKNFDSRLKSTLEKSGRLWEFMEAKEKRSLLLAEKLDLDNPPKERVKEVTTVLEKPEEIEVEIVESSGDPEFIQLYNLHEMIQRYRFAIYDRMDVLAREEKMKAEY